jgi:hypothetical protein
MIITRDNAVWWRRPDGIETQATPEQCAQEIERLRTRLEIVLTALHDFEEAVGESYDDEGGDIAGIEAELRAGGQSGKDADK